MSIPQKIELKAWHIIHLTLSALIGVVLFYSLSPRAALSFVSGSFLVQINIALLQHIWEWSQSKNSVALALIAIVSKYALLIGYLKFTHDVFNYDVKWLILGVGFLSVSSVVFVIRNGLKRNEMGTKI